MVDYPEAKTGNAPADDLPAVMTRAEAERRLGSVVARSQLALFWERLWPELYLPLVLVALLVGLSWVGLWLLLPLWLRILVLIAFVGALVWTGRGVRHVAWPGWREALHRVELSSGYSHRPLTSLDDDLAAGSGDPLAVALWETHKRRMTAALRAIRAGFAHPEAFRRDPYALRVVALMLLVTGYAASDGERLTRMAALVRPDASAAAEPMRVDAWVTPPLYTARAPVYLTGETALLREPGAVIPVPQGSVVTVRAQGVRGLSVFARSGGQSHEIAAEGANGSEAVVAATADPSERTYTLTANSQIVVRDRDDTLESWSFSVEPDTPPTIHLTEDPEEQLSGALKFTYAASDDFGVVSAEAEIAPAPDADMGESKDGAVRPLVDAPKFPLSLPTRRSGTFSGETIRDLTSHPWAGSKVLLTLVVRDQAGQEGRSKPFEFTLPQRRFSKPVARAVVEQRRDLALDANNQVRALDAFDGLMIAPDKFDMPPRVYLGVDFAYRQLAAAKSDDDLRALLPMLWDLALSIEDGDLSLAEKALRDAQEALRKALENGASDEEISKLTEALRQALQNYMQALAQQMQQSPQQMPMSPGQQTLSSKDLDEMLRRIEELARTGSRDAARELLAQMQQMLENMQTGRGQTAPNGMSNEMMQMLNQLSEMIQKQQQLMDETNKANRDQQQGQDQEGRAPGEEQQQQQMTQEQLQELLKQLQQSQGDLQKQLQKLLSELAKKGPGQQPGQQQGQMSGKGQGPNGALDRAGRAMGQAERSLGQGEGDQAVGQQGDALDALRDGAKSLAEQMMQQGQGQGGGTQSSKPMDQDPLGRPRRSAGPDFGNSVKVPDEIDVQRARRILEELRRRFSDGERPRLELDYLERLLKRY